MSYTESRSDRRRVYDECVNPNGRPSRQLVDQWLVPSSCQCSSCAAVALSPTTTSSPSSSSSVSSRAAESLIDPLAPHAGFIPSSQWLKLERSVMDAIVPVILVQTPNYRPFPTYYLQPIGPGHKNITNINRLNNPQRDLHRWGRLQPRNITRHGWSRHPVCDKPDTSSRFYRRNVRLFLGERLAAYFGVSAKVFKATAMATSSPLYSILDCQVDSCDVVANGMLLIGYDNQETAEETAWRKKAETIYEEAVRIAEGKGSAKQSVKQLKKGKGRGKQQADGVVETPVTAAAPALQRRLPPVPPKKRNRYNTMLWSPHVAHRPRNRSGAGGLLDHCGVIVWNLFGCYNTPLNSDYILMTGLGTSSFYSFYHTNDQIDGSLIDPSRWLDRCVM
jgi:hypothetical protein